jgi:hypothetical protein
MKSFSLFYKEVEGNEGNKSMEEFINYLKEKNKYE